MNLGEPYREPVEIESLRPTWAAKWIDLDGDIGFHSPGAFTVGRGLVGFATIKDAKAGQVICPCPGNPEAYCWAWPKQTDAGTVCP